MGTGCNRNVSQWCKGEYHLANNNEDDLATIAVGRFRAVGSIYNNHGLLGSVIDSRVSTTTTFAYNAADQVVSTAVSGPGVTTQTISSVYNNSGRVTSQLLLDGTTQYKEYYPTGQLKKEYGSRTFPVEYSYDAQGRMKTMTTWQNYATLANAATTTWNYDATRGWLSSKFYHGQGSGTQYTYTPGGRIETRTWARAGVGGAGIRATYNYGSGNNGPDLTGITYGNDPVGTGPVTFGYDRRGRRTTIVNNGTTNALAYNDADILTGESYSGGTLAGRSVTIGYNSQLKKSSINANTPTAISQTFAYDNSGLLSTVTDSAYTSVYEYLPNSRLVSKITGKNAGQNRLVITKNYDAFDRLSQISNAPSVSAGISSTYAYNQANQRTNNTQADGSYWRYQYDTLGQVTSGKHYWSDTVPVAGQQFEYTHDTIGNRTQAKFGGDQTGGNLQQATYVPNLLNQYNNRSVPSGISIDGNAHASAVVTVNSQSAYRKGEYFWKEITVANNSVEVWANAQIQAALSGTTITNIGNKFVPKTPEIFGYDADGNLLNDGRWNYTWDAENRLIRMISRSTTVGPQQRLDFEYDYMGRRIRKKVWENIAGSGSPSSDLKFLYEGWNLIAELNGASTDAVVRSYIWGIDLSGNYQGAGGVGGLLGVKLASGSVHFATYDGNGNICGYIDGTSGQYSANYEYGPFGELIRMTGTMAKANPFRFSSKYQDDETELVYYGYRYLNASTGRWPNRDPLGEPGFELLRAKRPSALAGGPNKHLFVQNNPVSIIDPLGLWQWGWPPWGNKKKDEKCCEKKDASPYKDLADKFLTDLAAKVQEAEAEIGRAKVADILDKLGKAKFAIDSIKSICDARNPDGCDDFIKSGELVDCMLCCTSIHALFSNELAGLGFSVTCKLACKNAN